MLSDKVLAPVALSGYRPSMKRKRLKKGHTALEIDEGGYSRDAMGHRTDVPAIYNKQGRRLWHEEELSYGLGERVRCVSRAGTGWHKGSVEPSWWSRPISDVSTSWCRTACSNSSWPPAPGSSCPGCPSTTWSPNRAPGRTREIPQHPGALRCHRRAVARSAPSNGADHLPPPQIP